MDIFEWLKMYPEQQTVDMCHDDYTDRYIWRVTIPPEIRAKILALREERTRDVLTGDPAPQVTLAYVSKQLREVEASLALCWDNVPNEQQIKQICAEYLRDRLCEED